MPENPLLIFPNPVHVERTKLRGFGSRPPLPDSGQQADRLAPQFVSLLDAMDRQRIALQDNAFGLQPEQVLVLEVVGSIENFIRITRNIEGLEWQGESELDDIEPAFGFEDESHPDKNLKGRMFLVMTDQRALHQIHRLFNRWRRDGNTQFPDGLGELKKVFEQLYDIRPWGIEERVRETGILDDWNARLQYDQEVVNFTVELWFRRSERFRNASAAYVRSVIERSGGNVVDECVVSEIAYHALMGEVGIAEVRGIIEQFSQNRERQIELVQCEGIMHLRPSGQCLVYTPHVIDADDLIVAATPEQAAEIRSPKSRSGDPVVALLDGVPLTGHEAIHDRLAVDDPDDYQADYQARDRQHGTMMASLICHGDLNENGVPIDRTLYVRPILKPYRDFNDRLVEEIPENVLPVDLIHRAVRRIFDGDENDGPAAPTVRIINIAVCDKSRPFYRDVSPWARLLDWLAYKYNVLFIVSAGNHPKHLQLDIPRDSVAGQLSGVLENALIRAAARDTRNRRILSPAETINGLTLGSVHSDLSRARPLTGRVDPFVHQGFPSLISAHGPGYRRSIKPDLLLPGGRHRVVEPIVSQDAMAVVEIDSLISAPGQLVATPGTQTGAVGARHYTRGTSNAAALASRAASFLYEVLSDLRSEGEYSIPREYYAVLIKTLLVHASDWASVWTELKPMLKSVYDGRSLKEFASRFLGYGQASMQTVITCTDQRVTALGFGTLLADAGDEFSFPLPASLSGLREKRRLKITLAWLTPVNALNRKYRVAHLWFEASTVLAKNKRICPDRRMTRRGTVQHEIVEGTSAVDFRDDDELTIKVNCRDDGGEVVEPIRYGLAVTLQVAEGLAIPIYQEVRDRMGIRVQV